MKPTLYIHIGRPKVGSSAVQTFLNRNRQALLESGCYYPRTGLYHGASHKFSLVYLPGLADAHIVHGLDPEALYQSLIDEIVDSGASSAVISSENFWLADPHQIPGILQEAFDIRIIAYLRRQDDVIISSFIQEIKGGKLHLDHAMDSYLQDPGRLALLDYDEVLSNWERSFGFRAVSARFFEDLDENDGIEHNFLEFLGIAPREEFRFSPGRRNASPALDILKMIDEAHRFPIGEIAHRQFSGILTEVSEYLGEKALFDARQLISDTQRKQIIEYFAESNARLFRRYGEQRDCFPPLEENPEGPATSPEVSQARYQNTVLGIFAYQQQQIQSLSARLNRITHLEARREQEEESKRTGSPGFFQRLARRLRRPVRRP
jgi:hypothetical protein